MSDEQRGNRAIWLLEWHEQSREVGDPLPRFFQECWMQWWYMWESTWFWNCNGRRGSQKMKWWCVKPAKIKNHGKLRCLTQPHQAHQIAICVILALEIGYARQANVPCPARANNNRINTKPMGACNQFWPGLEW
jgi:hypothetical protein